MGNNLFEQPKCTTVLHDYYTRPLFEAHLLLDNLCVLVVPS